jgi:hypothetical protein
VLQTLNAKNSVVGSRMLWLFRRSSKIQGNIFNHFDSGVVLQLEFQFNLIVLAVKVECPITSHLRSCTREYFEYRLWNIFGCREIRIEKDYYFFLFFGQKMKFIWISKVSLPPLVTYRWGVFWHWKYYKLHHKKSQNQPLQKYYKSWKEIPSLIPQI